MVVALAAASLTFFAVQSKGQTVHEADLNDGGVWVSASNHAQFARMNKAVKQFDAGVQANVTPGSGLDILQDGSAVVGVSLATNQLIPIDPQTGRLDSSAAVTYPARAQRVANEYVPSTVDLRGGTLAMVDPRTGKVWAQRVGSSRPLQGVSLSTTSDPLATVGGVAAVTVDVTGGVHAVSAATGKVVTIPATGDSFGKPVPSRVKLRAGAVDITAVGTRWVVYDPVDDQLFAQGLDAPVAGGVRRTGSLAYAALQQAGPASDSVALETTSEVRLVGLGGDPDQGGVRLPNQAGTSEPPMVSRPVRLGSCVHGAWARTAVAYYGVNCGQDAATSAGTLTRPGDVPLRDGMALRTNHGLIVLNDLDTGDAWDLDSKPLKVDNWDSVVPPSQTDDNSKNKDKNVVDDTTTPQPPKAEPDTYKVRAGRTSKLHVLDNDTDSAGSILAIAPDEVTTPNVPGVATTVAGDGQSIDITVPADPQAKAFSFSYKVNNGSSAPHAQATVSVSVVDGSVNSPPTLRDGQAKIATTTYPVVTGGRLPLQVLGDWRDPECDSLTVSPADTGSLVDGLGRLVVRAGQKAGSEAVGYAVEDDHGGRTNAKLTLAVLGKDSSFRAPGTQPDVVRGVVGKPLQLEPLGNDIAGADPQEPDARMRLATEVRSQGSLTVDSNLDTGVVTVTGSAPGHYELTYGAQVGAGVAPGRIRVDLVSNPNPDAPPVAVPDSATVRDQTPVLADVLSNDYSPRADVLVTRSVTVDSASAWLRPSIYQGRWVRIEALEPAARGAKPRTGTVSYTVSDGTKTATGQVEVTQRPALDDALPIVQDDVATVRAQDSVTIPVMDNDSMAEGIPLVLDPGSVKVLNGAQNAFASGNVIRYVPEDRNPRTEEVRVIEYAVYPIGMREKAQTGRVTVTVKPLPTPTQQNQAPRARSFSASVVAGEPLTITVPTSGVDPDGDSVTVDGLVGEGGDSVNLSLGRVTSFGASTIQYEAYPRSAGTEVLHYRVRDRFGATSTGFVRIGVVQPGDPQPPVAVEDEVRAAPGKRVTVDVTENDLIARGDSVSLDYKDLNDKAELAKWKVDERNTYFSTTVREPGTGVQHLTYGISNGLFDPSRASVTVVPVPGYKNPPIAVDDVAKPKYGEDTALVDVLANDRDIDGDRSQLKVVRLLSPEGTIEGNRVRVKVLDHPHTVPYVIQDADGETAMALVYVPTGSDGSPFVVSGALIQMGKDSTLGVKLADYVKSPRARVIGITSGETISASPREDLTAEADGRDGLTLRSQNGYVGPAAVMLEVSDQETLDQKDFRTAYVSIPVQIGPKVPLLRCPDFAVTLNAAGRPRDIDIPTLCHAWVPPGMSFDDVQFETRWDPESRGVDLRRSGTGQRLVTIQAGSDAPSSTNGRIRIQARGADEVSYVRVHVVGLDRQGQTTAVDASGKPQTVAPPRMRPFTVTGLKAGSSQTVNLRGYLDSPLQKPDCSITSASVTSGKGLAVTRNGCDLTVTASGEASGQGTVDLVVSDGPGRAAPGRGTVEMLGKPGAPTDVVAVADRVNGGTARVGWVPPAYDGGSPITSYTVSWRGAASGSQPCTASPCTVAGLKDGQDYWFRVTAVNAVGESPASPEYGPVQPDTLPNPVTGVRQAGRGDGRLDVAWDAPPPKGSEVVQYNVRATDTTTGKITQATVAATALQTTLSNLVNNDEQGVAVRAANRLGWGPFGPVVTMQSAGTPPAVGSPTLNPRGPGAAASSEALKISWEPVSPNGPALVRYTVYRRVGSGAFSALGQTSPDTRTYTDTIPYDGQTYTYAVTATNGAGNESPRANTASFSSVAPPVQPNAPSVSTPTDNKGASVSVYLKDSRGSGYTRLQWQTDAGQSGFQSCGCSEDATRSFGVTGLGTSSQRMQVRVYNGVSWSPWSAWSNGYHPYGQTLDPTNLQASRSGNTITWSWDTPDNGRQTDQVQVRGAVDQTWNLDRQSVSFNGNPGNTYQLEVRAHTVAGWSGWVGPRQASIPEPDPVVKVQDPSTHRTAGTCNNYATCYEIEWTISNVKPGTYTYTCQSSSYGDFYSGSVTVTGPSSYRKTSWCVVDTRNNSWAGITLSGGPSGTFGDKNYNW
ncbi:Ig-like domain-containing protein [Phycicoccus ginsengisoli]